MTPTNCRRTASSLLVFVGLLVAGCTSTPPPLTDAERTDINETMTRVSLGLFESVDLQRAKLEGVDAHVLSRDHAYIVLTGMSTREPVDGPAQRTRFVMTSVFERVGEEWKIVRNHAAGTVQAQ